MKKTKWFTAVAVTSALLLGACGTEEAKEKKEEIVEVEKIDLAKEAANFKAFAMEQLPNLIEDLKLLDKHIQENELDSAQKLYPLVRMQVERIQPLQSSFKDEFALLDGKVEIGKESDLAGFAKVEELLFKDKKAADAKEVIAEVVKAAEELSTKLQSDTLDGTVILEDTSAMIETADNRLNGKIATFGDAEIYELKGNIEAVDQIVAAYKNRADSEEVAEITENIATLNDVIAFYEVGKEDYVKYSLFTNSQKEELIAALQNVTTSYQDMKKTIQ